jgi:hypothetical protein
MALSPVERKLRAKLAAYEQHARGLGNTRPATAAFLARFEREVDPDGVLPPEERERRAQYALRAHMVRLSLRAEQKRRRRMAAENA